MMQACRCRGALARAQRQVPSMASVQMTKSQQRGRPRSALCITLTSAGYAESIGHSCSPVSASTGQSRASNSLSKPACRVRQWVQSPQRSCRRASFGKVSACPRHHMAGAARCCCTRLCPLTMLSSECCRDRYNLGQRRMGVEPALDGMKGPSGGNSTETARKSAPSHRAYTTLRGATNHDVHTYALIVLCVNALPNDWRRRWA